MKLGRIFKLVTIDGKKYLTLVSFEYYKKTKEGVKILSGDNAGICCKSMSEIKEDGIYCENQKIEYFDEGLNIEIYKNYLNDNFSNHTFHFDEDCFEELSYLEKIYFELVKKYIGKEELIKKLISAIDIGIKNRTCDDFSSKLQRNVLIKDAISLETDFIVDIAQQFNLPYTIIDFKEYLNSYGDVANNKSIILSSLNSFLENDSFDPFDLKCGIVIVDNFDPSECKEFDAPQFILKQKLLAFSNLMNGIDLSITNVDEEEDITFNSKKLLFVFINKYGLKNCFSICGFNSSEQQTHVSMDGFINQITDIIDVDKASIEKYSLIIKSLIEDINCDYPLAKINYDDDFIKDLSSYCFENNCSTTKIKKLLLNLIKENEYDMLIGKTNDVNLRIRKENT